MARTVLIALVALLLSPGLSAAGPILSDADYVWRFTGSVTEVAADTSQDVHYAPLLGVGDPIAGLVALDLPPGTEASGTVSLPLFPLGADDAILRAAFTARPGFDPDAPGAPPADFVFLSGSNVFVTFDGPTGALLDIGGQSEQGYLGSPFLQFRWGLGGGTIQQLAGEESASVPSHLFTYRWQAEPMAFRQVGEPPSVVLLATALVLLAGLLAGGRDERAAAGRRDP